MVAHNGERVAVSGGIYCSTASRLHECKIELVMFKTCSSATSAAKRCCTPLWFVNV